MSSESIAFFRAQIDGAKDGNINSLAIRMGKYLLATPQVKAIFLKSQTYFQELKVQPEFCTLEGNLFGNLAKLIALCPLEILQLSTWGSAVGFSVASTPLNSNSLWYPIDKIAEYFNGHYELPRLTDLDSQGEFQCSLHVSQTVIPQILLARKLVDAIHILIVCVCSPVSRSLADKLINDCEKWQKNAHTYLECIEKRPLIDSHEVWLKFHLFYMADDFQLDTISKLVKYFPPKDLDKQKTFLHEVLDQVIMAIESSSSTIATTTVDAADQPFSHTDIAKVDVASESTYIIGNFLVTIDSFGQPRFRDKNNGRSVPIKLKPQEKSVLLKFLTNRHHRLTVGWIKSLITNEEKKAAAVVKLISAVNGKLCEKGDPRVIVKVIERGEYLNPEAMSYELLVSS